MMFDKVSRTVLGFIMVLAGVYFLHMGKLETWIAILLLVLGGFFVSQTVMLSVINGALQTLLKAWSSWKKS